MLHLQKNNLVTGLSKNLVEIRQLEVDWYCNNYGTIVGQATLLAGFAFAQLTTPMPDPEPPFVLELAYLFLTSSALGFELTAIIVSTFLSTWAPSLALRGKAGSADLHRAVDALRDYQALSFGFFILGWIIFFVSSIFQIWIYFRRRVAVVVTFPFLCFLLAIAYYTCDITAKLQLDERDSVSGKVEHFHSYEYVSDIDHGLSTMGPGQREVNNNGDGAFGTCPVHETFIPSLASERRSHS
mmetsp:Transcript_61287/g.176387  ORF Transcript_61287/g.176387 Transcript_61287/m.176387 type:complete len:241 (-) Transcript_61287:81-803(-)